MAVGVTSGGDLFGGTQVTFTDVLGDKQFNIFAASVSQYRTMSFSYINLSRRLQYAIAGVLADAVLLRLRSGGPLRPRVRLHRSRYGDRHADGSRRVGFGDLPAEPLCTVRADRRAAAVQAGVRRAWPAADRRSNISIDSVRPDAVRGRHVPAARRELRARDDDLPRVRAALGRHDVARVRVRALASAACSRDRRSMAMRATTCGSAPTASSLSAHAATRAGASSPATSTSAATPSCAATTTWRSSATRGSSPTPSCGSRSSKRR